MTLVDAHCHLERTDYEDAAAVIARAKAAGLVRAVLVGQFQGPGDFGNALQLAQAFPDFLVATMGLHPHEAERASEADWAELERLCALPDVRAVGEAGLDFWYDRSPRDVQRASLERQCDLARRLDKPLVIHVRDGAPGSGADAHAECHATLRAQGITRAVIHCFTADTDVARRYLELGLMLSVAGVVTYKKTEPLQDAVRFCPLDRLMVETDSPYLAPVPYRGKRNEPGYVAETVKKVAELKGLGPEEVAVATARNAAGFFGFSLPTPGPA